MAGDPESEADDDMMRAFLRGRRESVLAIVEGLDEEAGHREGTPRRHGAAGWPLTTRRIGNLSVNNEEDQHAIDR